MLTRTQAQGDISFCNIDFSYATRPNVLTNVNLQVPAAKMVALVGATGSGKSTIAKLVLRFYEPDRGSISIGGEPLSNFTLTSLRHQIGFVGQDSFMVDGTISENISYGATDASQHAIEDAARAAEALEFIEKLPNGFATLVGERDKSYLEGSGNVWRLPAHYLKNPAVLILDEATSAVDNETERLIQRSLLRIAQDRTVLVIAHRLSTIRRADVIHVLAAGQIVESGTHEQLLQKQQVYANLWRIQTGEFE